MKLWDKGYDIDKEIEKFTVGDDYILDKKLIKYDCIASIAHAKMLNKIGILNKTESKKIVNLLNEIIEIDEKGNFEIFPEDEDCHTAIENFLVKMIGETGKKIHTGRSRNDQIMVALKLYMIDELNKIKKVIEILIDSLDNLSKNTTLIPGYTHMRKAMPSSVELWAKGYIGNFKSDIILIDGALKYLDSNPLGSAAGYGTNIGLDKDYTAKLLGFTKLEEITAVQNSRGKNEYTVINVMLQVMLDLAKLSTDLIMYSMPEFGFFKIPKEFCTGSSIMPHKKNPDVLELIRAKSGIVQGNLVSTLSLINGLPSGYNRDFQLTKKPLMESIDITFASLKIMIKVVDEIEINKENCKKAMTEELFSTHNVFELVKKGMSFRDAYKKIAQDIN